MRKTKKIKIDTTPKIFDSYEELWNRDIDNLCVFPVISNYEIVGYKLEFIDEAEEKYNNIAEEFCRKGILNTKGIIREIKNCPYWVALEIKIRMDSIEDYYIN